MNRIKPALIWLLVVAPIFLAVSSSYAHYNSIKVNNKYAEGFRRDLIDAVNQEKPFELKELTKFEWDSMIVFHPYTSRDVMEKTVGREWTTYTYLGYLLIQKTFLGDYPLDDDRFHKIVFLKDERVVLDLTLDRGEVDFTQIQGPVFPEDSKFGIQGNVLTFIEDEIEE